MLEKLFWMVMGAVVLVLLGIVGELLESRRRLREEERVLAELDREWGDHE